MNKCNVRNISHDVSHEYGGGCRRSLYIFVRDGQSLQPEEGGWSKYPRWQMI
jgi:hypothetical protein